MCDYPFESCGVVGQSGCDHVQRCRRAHGCLRPYGRGRAAWSACGGRLCVGDLDSDGAIAVELPAQFYLVTGSLGSIDYSTVKPLASATPIWGFLEAKMPKSGSRGKNTIPLLLYGVASRCMVRAVLYCLYFCGRSQTRVFAIWPKCSNLAVEVSTCTKVERPVEVIQHW